MGLQFLLEELAQQKPLQRKRAVSQKKKPNRSPEPDALSPRNLQKKPLFCLGKKFNNLYLTEREAQCIAQMLKGKTIGSVAETLGLSPRTVEYYVKNMKNKLNCRTKFDLLEKIYASDLIANIERNPEAFNP